MKTILFYLSLPRRFKELKDLIGYMQPVGKIGKIQKIFDIQYKPTETPCADIKWGYSDT